VHAIFVTQLVDPRDPALGFTVGWIRALAARADGVTVIANEVRHTDLGPGIDVVSLGKERGAGKVARGLAFGRAVLLATRRRPAMLLAHMCPDYLTLAAPVAKLRRVPTILWFAHPSVTWHLAVAERLADGIVTSLPGAYPRESPKVRVIGQAIDTAALVFAPRPRYADGPRLLALGRTSPAKGFDRIIRAVARVRSEGLGATLRIVGPSATAAEQLHAEELAALVEELRVQDAVTLAPGVAPAEVSGVISESDILVNAMVEGSGDKVVFEAMALGRPVLVSNPAFMSLIDDLPLELSFLRDDEVSLASAIHRLSATDPADTGATLRTLRERVVSKHSIDHWAEKVFAYAEELR
jgi:glycosyltransferase involved in cell wall biosynthesis